MLQFLKRLFASVILSVLVFPLYAENLVAIKNVPLPPLPGTPTSAVTALFVSSGQLILVQGEQYSQLSGDHSTWQAASPATVLPLPPAVPDGLPATGDVTSVVDQDRSLFVSTRRTADMPYDTLWRWTAASGWVRCGDLPGQVVLGAARAIGQAHLLYLINTSTGAQLVTYHSITQAFAKQGVPYVTPAQRGVGWGNGMVWESSDSQGVSRLHFSEVEGNKLLLRPLDWAMIIVYLVAIAGIGAYCYWREEKQSTSEFFVGNRTIPFWAAAISLYVTSTSSIGYIATTAKAFATNWQYLMNNVLGVFGLVFVAIWIVPMLRRLKLVSVFDYLEQRFHPSVRMMASAMCIVLHLGGRMSIILFLPSLAIATITGFDMVWSILIMGLVTVAYTALGGMRAVIWTDVLQLIVKVGGLIFATWFIVSKLHGGFAEFIETASAGNKMQMLDWSFDLTKPTVWAFVFLVFMETVLTFPKDQVLMQRVFTTKSDKDAGRSVWLFAAIVVPAAMLFYLIGTGLWVFYQNHPERMNPLLAVDATFPLFIAAELPAGITGLMIAGIFAASMATCSSIMNSVATMVSVDFYERLAKQPTQATSIRLAEWVTALAGFIGIGLALLLSRYNIGSYLDVALDLYGLLGGGFAGAYTLGMFTRRANWQGVLIGMVSSVVMTFIAWSVNLVHPFIYLAIAILFSIVFGYIGSLFFPAPAPESLEGLIIQR
jgi:SSS family solute:Na+ symporter